MAVISIQGICRAEVLDTSAVGEHSHEIMDGELTEDEVRKVVNKAKLRKSTKIDYL